MMCTRLLLIPLFLCGAISYVTASSNSNARFDQRRVRIGPSTESTGEVEMVATAWFTGWHAQDFTLKNVSWDKYTHLTYAFKLTTEDPSNITLPEEDATLLPQFVASAHENDVKALLSIRIILALGPPAALERVGRLTAS